jgi:hypothetical protein
MNSNGPFRLSIVLVLALSAAALETGCAPGPGGIGVGASILGKGAANQKTKEDLYDKLEQCEDLIEASIRRASDELVRADNSRQTKRLTLIWQMRISLWRGTTTRTTRSEAFDL